MPRTAPRPGADGVRGAGIFKTPSLVAGTTGDGGWAIVAWLTGAIVSLAGALCYAELASAYRHAGGDYHFLERAYGRPQRSTFREDSRAAAD